MSDNKELSLKESQEAALEVLKVISRICDEEGLRYYLAWGTLLGAVRHSGFIPWDDDIDIMMPRPDYDKLIEYYIEHKDQLKNYQLLNIYTNKDYIYILSRFSDSRFYVKYKDAIDYGLGAFVDIYPLDGLGNDYSTAKKNMKKYGFLRHIIKLHEPGIYIPSPDGVAKSVLKKISYDVSAIFGREYMIKYVDKKCSKIDFDSSKYVGIPTVETMESCILKKEWIEKSVDKEFEDSIFHIPAKYDELLTHRYGDYMKLPPKEEQIAHHFYSIFRR